MAVEPGIRALRPALPCLIGSGGVAFWWIMKRRSGFTLIEILVVITVISILAAISMQVVGGLISQARHSATVATIEKIQGLLDARATAFDRLTIRNPSGTGTIRRYLENSSELQMVDNFYGAAIGPSQRLMLTRKLFEAKYFPQYPAELADQMVTVVLPINRGMHGLYPDLVDASGVPNPKADNSEILYDFLVNSNVLGTTPVANDTFSTAEVRDADNDGLPSFIDAWGNPLRFYRWPTRLFRPTGAGGAIDIATARQIFATLPSMTGNLQTDLARDPDDPLRDCSAIAGFEGSQLSGTAVLAHTPATYWVFLVVSSGPDGVFGMRRPEDIPANYAPGDIRGFGFLGVLDPDAPAGAINDDIIHLSIHAGGK